MRDHKLTILASWICSASGLYYDRDHLWQWHGKLDCIHQRKKFAGLLVKYLEVETKPNPVARLLQLNSSSSCFWSADFTL